MNTYGLLSPGAGDDAGNAAHMLHGILKQNQVHDSVCLIVLIQRLHRDSVVKPWVSLTALEAHKFARGAQLFAGA